MKNEQIFVKGTFDLSNASKGTSFVKKGSAWLGKGRIEQDLIMDEKNTWRELFQKRERERGNMKATQLILLKGIDWEGNVALKEKVLQNEVIEKETFDWKGRLDWKGKV